MILEFYLWCAMILSFLFYAFIAYLLYKLVFGFIIPVYRTTKKVKQGFREMNERMRQEAGYNEQSSRTKVESTAPNKDEGDYIEFEEVK
jgi:hypothetical protein